MTGAQKERGKLVVPLSTSGKMIYSLNDVRRKMSWKITQKAVKWSVYLGNEGNFDVCQSTHHKNKNGS